MNNRADMAVCVAGTGQKDNGLWRSRKPNRAGLREAGLHDVASAPTQESESALRVLQERLSPLYRNGSAARVWAV